MEDDDAVRIIAIFSKWFHFVFFLVKFKLAGLVIMCFNDCYWLFDA